MPKRAFNIATVLRRIRQAIRPLPKAAMFALAEEGYTSVFRQLIACILSIRTRDEVSLVAARRLFTAAPAPEDLTGRALEEIDRLISDVSFHRPKAAQIRDIAGITVNQFGGTLPCDAEILRGSGASGRNARTWRSASPAERREFRSTFMSIA